MPDSTCITCGRIIPEGRHICLLCERVNEMQTFRQRKTKTDADWIPCRERMPEREGRYLVYDRVSKAQFVTQYWEDGTWRTVRAEITHWMPLPDDPKGAESK